LKDVVFFLHRVYPDGRGKRDDLKLSTFLKALKVIRSRFKVVPLYDILTESSSDRRAAITFDDGYADNFVYAYPILKRMGIPAHIFITANRINGSGLRRTLFDYWDGKVSMGELFKPSSMYRGHEDFIKRGSSDEFLSWEELEAMKDVFSFGAHGGNHFSFPFRDEVKGFFNGSNFHWTVLLYCKDPFVGLPLFDTRSELDVRRFYPSQELIDFCRDFPKSRGWEEELKREIGRSFDSFGVFEGEGEARRRVEEELRGSKEKIEERLNVSVDTFSWPFGHYSDFSREVARRVYRFVFTTKKGFVDRAEIDEIPRVSLGKDIFTVLGRVIAFSTDVGFSIYERFKKEKVL